MKIIPKYQQGGYASYFAQYTAVPFPTTQQQKAVASEKELVTTKSKDTKDENISQKDILDLMKNTKGLANEMQQTMSGLVNSMKLSSMLGATSDDMLRIYAQFKVQSEIMANNKVEFDKAVDQLKKDGSLTDPAISTTGNLLYQKRDGSLGEVSVQAYLSNPKNYTVISNDQFTKLRQYSSSMAFDKDYINVLDNSMSAQKFNKIVKDLKNDIGESNTSFSGVANYNQNLKEGLTALNNLSDEDKSRILSNFSKTGIYDFTVVHNSNAKQIQQVIKTITDLMPDNAKTWAAYKVGKKDKEAATMAVVAGLLLGGIKTTDTYDVKYGKTKDGTSSQGGGSDSDDVKINTATKFVIGGGNPTQFIIHSDGGSGIQVSARVMPLTTNNGDYLGTNATAQSAFSGQFSPVLDAQNITVAGKHIDTALLNEIIVRDGNIASVDFPIIRDQNGDIRPDLSLETVSKKLKADKELQRMGININDPEQVKNNIDKINQVYQKCQLPPAYNQDGTPNNTTWMRFGVMNVQTTENVIGDDVDQRLVQEIQDKNIINNFKRIMKGVDKNYQFPSGIFSTDTVYNTELWVPLKVDVNTSMANEKIKPGQFNDIEAKQQAAQKHAQLTNSRIY